MTFQNMMKMDPVIRQALVSRGTLLLAVICIAVMIALVGHAGAVLPAGESFAPAQYCHW